MFGTVSANKSHNSLYRLDKRFSEQLVGIDFLIFAGVMMAVGLSVFEKVYNPIFRERAGYDFLTRPAPCITEAFSSLKPVEIAMARFLFLPDAMKRGMLPAQDRTPIVAITAQAGFASVPK